MWTVFSDKLSFLLVKIETIGQLLIKIIDFMCFHENFLMIFTIKRQILKNKKYSYRKAKFKNRSA
jgi:hypothetical protein